MHTAYCLAKNLLAPAKLIGSPVGGIYSGLAPLVSVIQEESLSEGAASASNLRSVLYMKLQ